jgi:hypothetical protein
MSNVRAQEAVMEELDKYVLEQAKIEVEHTRSGPTKVLAFHIAINAGAVSTLFSWSSRSSSSAPVPEAIKCAITLALFALLVWVVALIGKNHISYLRYRNLQVQFQKRNSETLEGAFSLPPGWLAENVVSLLTRLSGWDFYAYVAGLVAALGIAGVWVA